MDFFPGHFQGFGGPHVHIPPQGAFEVVLRNGTSYHLIYEQTLAICPRLDNVITHGRIIDVGAVADDIAMDYPTLPGAARIEDPDKVYRSLHRLFAALRDSVGNRDALHQILIHEVFPHELDALNGGALYPKIDGLRAGRRMFVVCANFAKRTESKFIASGLAEALIYHQHTILAREHPRYFAIWGMAFVDLQPLLPRREQENCLQALAPRFEDIRNSGLYGYMDRRLGVLIHLIEDVMGIGLPRRYLDDDCWSRGRNKFRSPRFSHRCMRPHTTPPLPRLFQHQQWSPLNMLTYPSQPPALTLPMPRPLMSMPYRRDPCEGSEVAIASALDELNANDALLNMNQVHLQGQIEEVKDGVEAIGQDVQFMGAQVQEVGDQVREILARVI